MSSDVLGLLAVNGLFLLAGAGVTRAVGWWRAGIGLVRSLGIAYLAGVATFGVVAQLLYVCGASLATWQVVLVCLVPAAGLAVPAREGESRSPIPFTRWHLLAVPIVAMLALIAVDLWYQPLWAYDSWTFWTPKAHALWALNGLRPSWFTAADLTSKDYPILLPSVEAAGFRFSGYETRLLDVQSLLFLAAFLRAVYEVSALRARPIVLWAVLAMLAIAPSVTNQLAAAEADIPVAVLFASAGMAGMVWLTERRPAALGVAGVLSAGAAATKVEGLEFTVALFIALALATRSWRGGLGAAATGAVAIAVGILPWRIWLHRHGVPNQASLSRLTDLGFMLRHISRVPTAAGYMLVKMLDPRAWVLAIPLFGVVGWRARKLPDRRVIVFVTTCAALSFVGLAFAYWSTRLDLHYQLATSARRVITGVVFFCAAATPFLSERT